MVDKNIVLLRNTDISPENYCSQEKYLDHQLEQYKLYVESVERLAERRMVSPAELFGGVRLK